MKNIILLFFSVIALFGCTQTVKSKDSDLVYVKDPTNPNRRILKRTAVQRGKLELFSRSDPKKEEFRVNKYLWDACIDILSHFPAMHIQPNVGIFETDYLASQGKNIKVRCRILGPKIFSHNIQVTVFEKAHDHVITSYEDKKIKSEILLRARELRANHG